MNFNLEEAVEKIKNNKSFLRLKKVIEDNSYHNKEPVYNHSIKTYNIAQREIAATFISNAEAKEKFNNYINQEISGIKKKDLMMIFALTHDIGKMIVFDDNGEKFHINQKIEEGTTLANGHDYWGSLIIESVLENTNLSKDAIEFLSKCIRLHNTFNSCWRQYKNLGANRVLEEMKRVSENIHVELIFNGYCDCYSALPFQEAIPLIHEIFNNPKAYSQLKHSIMD